MNASRKDDWVQPPNRLNGKVKVGLNWLGAALVGAIASAGVLYQIHRTEVTAIQADASERAILLATVKRDNKIIANMELQIRYVTRVNQIIAMRLGLKPTDLPPEPLLQGDTWQDDPVPQGKVDFKHMLETLDTGRFEARQRGPQ